jgi:hypothetical protein
MRTLSGPLAAAIAATSVAPGFLVSIAFPTPVYFSSRGDVTYSSQLYSSQAMNVAGYAADGNAEQRAVLKIQNLDDALAALILNYGIAERAITISIFYGDGPTITDVVKVFEGVGDKAEILEREVSITLASQALQTLVAPRDVISKGNGFNWLPASGSKLSWNGDTIIFQ